MFGSFGGNKRKEFWHFKGKVKGKERDDTDACYFLIKKNLKPSKTSNFEGREFWKFIEDFKMFFYIFFHFFKTKILL